MNAPLQASIDYASRQRFLPDARVRGVLVNADIGAGMSYGELFHADRSTGGEFVRFQAIGVDHRNGYDIVRAAGGDAYVIVSFAAHAKERGLSQLRAHIAFNRDYYAALQSLAS